VAAVEHGDNPLDFWSAETSLGVALARDYQPLSHFMSRRCTSHWERRSR